MEGLSSKLICVIALANCSLIASESDSQFIGRWDSYVMSANLNHPIVENDRKVKESDFLKKLGANCGSIFQEKWNNFKKNNNNFTISWNEENIGEYKNRIKQIFDSNHKLKMPLRDKIIFADMCISRALDDIKRDNGIFETKAKFEFDPYISGEGKDLQYWRPFYIENVVFSGGGGKGLAYENTLKILEENGYFNAVKRVAGTSVGALVATGASLTSDVNQIKVFSQGMLSAIKDKSGLKKLKYPLKFTMQTTYYGSALGVVKFLDQFSIQRVMEFLKRDDVKVYLEGKKSSIKNYLQIQKQTMGLSKLKSSKKAIRLDRAYYALDRLQKFKDFDLNKKREEKDMVTFRDLYFLSKIPVSNNHFKELFITGWNATEKKECYFSAKTVPHMPIAYAARISMALPGAFYGIEMDISKYSDSRKNGKVCQFFDGGIKSNTPVEIFTDINLPKTISQNQRDILLQDAHSKTLSLVFDNAGYGFSSISEKQEEEESRTTSALSKLLKVFGVTRNRKDYATFIKEEMEKLKGSNVIVVGHTRLGTLSLNPTEFDRKVANFAVNSTVMEWCRQHSNEAVMIKSDSRKDLEDLMKKDIKVLSKIKQINSNKTNDNRKKQSQGAVKFLQEKKGTKRPGSIRIKMINNSHI